MVSVHTTSPIRLRRVSPVWAGVRQRLGAGVYWAGRREGAVGRIELRCARFQRAREWRQSGGGTLRTSHGDLFFPDHCFLQLTSGVMFDPSWHVDTAAGLLALACSRIDAFVTDAFGACVEYAPSLPEWSGLEDSEWCDFQVMLQLDGGGECHCGWLRASATTVISILSTPGWKPVQLDGLEYVDALSLVCGLAISRRLVSPSWLARLRAGDAIMLGADAACSDAFIHLGRRLVIHLRDVDDSSAYAVFDGWRMSGVNDYVSELPPPVGGPQIDSSATQEIPVDDIDVVLTFVTGRIVLQLGQLRSLYPGALLPIHRSADGRVSLEVNGKKIGHGELVDIAGSLAVEILELGAAS